jgi:hypothetical protein
VIDPIDDGLDDSPDVPESEGPSWFACPMLPRSDMLAVIERHRVLDGRAVNLFRNALQRKPRSDLFEHYLGPHLYHPGSHYIYTTPDPDRFRFTNWRPEITALAIEHRSVAPCAVFSNTLSWIDEANLLPGERTHNGGFCVYTFEPDSNALEDQLRVIYSGQLRHIDSDLRRYRDYRGYEVVYSGSKSLHFHFCFDLRHLKRDLAVTGNSSYRDNWTRDLPDNLLRPAYAVSWDRLAARFCEIADLQPDPRLRSWEQLRRCPWAFRLVKRAHPLGLPSGYLIPQPVLASNIFRNIKRAATDWFHHPDKLGELCRKEQVRRRKPVIELEFNVTSGEQELFARHAPAIFEQIIGATPQARHTASPGAQYPKFAGFQVNETGFRCHFYNGPGDKNPSSFCEGNRSRILLQGRHNFDSDGIPLGTTPNQIFDWIVSQNRVEGDLPPDDWITRRYKAAVHDRASLIQFIDDHIVEMIAPPVESVRPAWIEKLMGRDDIPNTHVLIRGPQGCGKSTKTMTKIPIIHETHPGVIFFRHRRFSRPRKKSRLSSGSTRTKGSSHTCTCRSRRFMNGSVHHQIGSTISTSWKKAGRPGCTLSLSGSGVCTIRCSRIGADYSI